MDRRTFVWSSAALAAAPASAAMPGPFRRVRPGDPTWPGAPAWEALNRQVGGRLGKVASPWQACRAAPDSADCAALFKNLKNPYFIRDQAVLTQTLGWTDAWTSQPSAYVVAAETALDVQAAVNFARERRLRLVVKGGGHSYLGASNAADSLLIWTRRMQGIALHEAFVPKGGEGKIAPQPAVEIGAGAIWAEAYDAVTTKAGRYVQGGGCTTVGVAGLVLGGGFGSFSKAYGAAAGRLIEAEVVTADGRIRTVNAFSDPDLYWALKGGGGGGFGVVTRLALRTHALPKFFGAANLQVAAHSDEAFRRLVALVMTHYRDRLFNAHWGEQIRFHADRRMTAQMVFQGLDRSEAEAAWKPFIEAIRAAPADFSIQTPLIFALPAQRMWDPEFLRALPGVANFDDRPGAPSGAFFWSGDGGQVGQVIDGYQSVWLPQGLLAAERIDALVDALVLAARNWSVGLHFNKGLAGADATARALARDTATNPAMLDAFALAILGGEQQPAYPGVRGHEPDIAKGREHARAISVAAEPLKRLSGRPASYVSETDYFQDDWQTAFWGENYPRLLKIKASYDPTGLFFTHHGVGTEGWSADGFGRRG